LLFTDRYKKTSPHIAFFGMLLVVVSLFFSRFLISIGFIIIIANSFFEGDFKRKINYIKQNTAAFLIVLLLLFHLIGLIYTNNISKGLTDIRLKSFLLLILFYGTGSRLSEKQKSIVFNVYILSALLAAIIGIYRFYFLIEPKGLEDLRGISFLGGNLYQAIFIVLAIIISTFFLINNSKHQFLYIISIFVFIFYLFILNSLTGYILPAAFVIYNLGFFLFQLKDKKQRNYLIIVSLLIIAIPISYFFYSVHQFYQTDKVNYNSLPIKTVNGNPYTHNTINKQFENGHYLYLYICKKELEKEWNKRSKIPYDSLDKKNQELKFTLIRYLTSKNLRKDSVGVWALSNQDIKNIENGYANYLYTDKFSIKGRIYLIIWQLDQYLKHQYANRQTISQRIVYIKIAKEIIEDYFFLGTSPGDAQDISKQYFKKYPTGLSLDYANIVHNQFILEFVSLGIGGGLSFIFIFFYPYFKLKLWKDYLATSFYLIITLSLFAEFLFETQLGITFFATFYSLLIFKE